MEEAFDDLRVARLECGSFAGAPGYVHRKRIPWTIIVQPTEGSYVVTGPERSTPIATREVCLVAAHTPIAFAHVPDRRGRMSARFIHVQATWRDVLDPCALRITPHRIAGAAAARIGEAIAALERRSGDGFVDRFARLSLACGALAEALATARPHPDADALVAAAARLGPLAQWLKANLGRPLAIADLARAAGLSRSRLHAVCVAHLRRPPMAWLKDLRLAEAAHRLLVGGGGVAEVAEAVGFANPFHFSREFSRRYGMPPRRYREAQRSG